MEQNTVENAISFRPCNRAAEKELNSCIRGIAILDDGDKEIAAIFAARGLSFESGKAVVVSLDEVKREEAKAMYIRKTRKNIRSLMGPALAMSFLFCGFSFGWITDGFCRFLVAACITWAAAIIWG